jgi:hypothetical protein
LEEDLALPGEEIDDQDKEATVKEEDMESTLDMTREKRRVAVVRDQLPLEVDNLPQIEDHPMDTMMMEVEVNNFESSQDIWIV